MAVAVGTFNTLAWGSSDTAVLTKPTSTAERDVLVAHVAFLAGDITGVPSGWTLLSKKTSANFGGAAYVYYKVAGTSEPADYTFTNDTLTTRAGAIFRVTGAISSFTAVGASDIVNDDTPTYTATVTPTVASSLILFFITGINACTAASAYALTTSSPTFTELYDFANGGALLAMAYGVRTETTATGNATATISADVGADSFGQVAVIAPSAALTVNADLLSITSSVLKPSIAIPVRSPVSFIASIIDPTVLETAHKWANTAKNAVTFANTSKNAATVSNTSKNASTFTNTSKS